MKSSTFGLGLFFSLLRTIYFTQNVLYIADVCKPGWSYFNGICYSTSHSCKNWTEAEKTCQAYSGNLITVRNQEENVYIQHRLNGAKGWIGLNDRAVEGTFDWADNQTSNFSYWAKNQPNNFNNEDCVHTLGVRHSFMWNDVNCGTCHNYTCSEGLWVTYLFYIPTGVTIIIIIITIIISTFISSYSKAISDCPKPFSKRDYKNTSSWKGLLLTSFWKCGFSEIEDGLLSRLQALRVIFIYFICILSLSYCQRRS